ncbi:MAG: hypothetical protein AB1705_02135 [Verrucomicrobiota bacterium]
MKLVILEEAEQDLIEGYCFYEEQAEELGDYFLDSLFADIESLHQTSIGHWRFLRSRESILF